MTRFHRSVNTSLALSSTVALFIPLAAGLPSLAEPNTIAPCYAGNLGSESQIVKVIDQRAPGSSSASRKFTNSFTFVAPAGYMISSVDVKRLKGGANASYSDKWLPSGGNFSSRTQSENAYQESLRALAAFNSSEGYARARAEYEAAGSQMSNWFNQVSSGGQGSYEFTMAVSPNSLSDGLLDAYTDVIGRYRVTLGLRCLGTAQDQRTYFQAVAQRSIERYGLNRSNASNPQGQGGGWSSGSSETTHTPNQSSSVDLSGTWRANDGGTYIIRQSGNSISWRGRGGNFRNSFNGQISGNTIMGYWQDTAGSQTQNSGQLNLRIENGNRIVRISHTGAFAGSTWEKGNAWSNSNDQTSTTTNQPSAVNLSGTWRANDGGTYIIRQSGNSISWRGRGGNFRNSFNGQIRGRTITGYWQDTAGSQTQNSGQLILRIENGNRIVRIGHTGAFTGSIWEKALR